MQIQVISVSVNHVPNAKGGYEIAEVAYKDVAQGKVAGKKIMSFTDKPLFNAVKAMVAGKTYDVAIAKETSAKDGKDYWNWKSVTEAGDAPAPTSKPGTPAPRNTYETPEERALKQRLIVRQSSLNIAVDMLKTDKVLPNKADVLSLAQELFDWVYATDPTPVNSDDIPY